MTTQTYRVRTRQARGSHRATAWSRGPLTALVFVLGVVAACNRSDATTTEDAPPDNPMQTPDNPTNGQIELRSEQVSGRVDSGKLRVEIPFAATASGSGSLVVSIATVDGRRTIAERELSYEVSKDEDDVLETTLDLPSDLETQAQLFEYNLFIQDRTTLHIRRSLLHVLTPFEVQLEGPRTISRGKQVSYRVVARHPVTRAPLENRRILLRVQEGDEVVEELSDRTGEEGTVSFFVDLPETGDYQVTAVAEDELVEERVEEPVEVEPADSRVLLTTDKPIYKPGQTLHLRALALRRGGNTPLADATVRFEVEDAKSNKIFQVDLSTDEHGIAATDFALGRILNEGTFTVRAIVDGEPSEKTVTVTQYALPKFRVGITPDQSWYQPGDKVTAVIDARYFFGRPVAQGSLTIELGAAVAGEQIFDTVIAQTDAEGRYQAELTLPNVLPGLGINAGNALGFVRVTALDAAGQQVVQEQPLTIAGSAVNVSVVPESTTVVPGVSNRWLVFVNDPLGAPIADAEVFIDYESETLSGTTNEFGYLEIAYEPTSSAATSASVRVEAEGQPPVELPFTFEVQSGADHLILRTDKSVYDVGETLELEVLTSRDSAFVFVDWLNSGQAVDMETLSVEDGRATSRQTLDNTLLGSNRISAYVVDEDGNIVRTGRNVFVRNSGALNIELETDKPIYQPGEPARLTFHVEDETGAPQVAALGVQIVDEAVFSVIDARPGLLKTYFELEDSFATPSYQLRAPGGSLSELLFNASADDDPARSQAAQSRVEANLAALGQPLVTGIQSASWSRTVTQGKGLLEPYYEEAKQAVLDDASRAASAVLRELAELGCVLDNYYCEATGQAVLETLRERLGERIRGVDFWGNDYVNAPMAFDDALRWVSRGPDERADTEDDGAIVISFGELEVNVDGQGRDLGGELVPLPANPEVVNDGVVDFDEGADDDSPSGPGEPEPEPEEPGAAPRVRRDFPETLYVNPALITDPDGTASVELDLADSITEWRVSSLGHTQNGKLGGGVSGITVFQDFFVDIDFPATLTRGDEVEFPIAVYNYLDEPQTVTLELTEEDWYTALGSTSLDVQLEAGQVTSVSFPVRVERVGLRTLTVTALGTERSDAVARSVLVEPDGKAFPLAMSGSVASGGVDHTVTFPDGTVEGSEELYLDVFPAYLAQAVQGMDSVLQVPSGCFEQTTSTTWPNVLVTRYMQQTDQITPEILARAQSLISAGYQRLLTFEHPGGGFSWFGTSDPEPFLSVTAFGLMEFSDMAKVHAVDDAMIARTRDYILAQQDPDGSWQGDISEFFSFHTSQVRNTAFVLWSLATAEYNGPEMALGLDFVRTNLEADDAYTLAIIANAMVQLGASDASTVIDQLLSMQQVDGDKIYWSTETQTNFYGAGNDAAVSTTALVAHALLLDGGHAPVIEGALNYITAAKDPQGNFGSTQSTTWSLRTLLLAATNGTEGAEGTLTVSVDGDVFSTLELTEDRSEVMTRLDMKNYATPGEHQVTVLFDGNGKVSYNLVSRHHLPWDTVEPPEQGPLSVSVEYDREQLQVDETVTAHVAIESHLEQTQNMVLVTVGLPPGFEVDTNDLTAYVEQGSLSRFEVTGRQVIFYITELGALSTLELDYDLRATLPIRASDGGAEVYPYYEPDKKSQAAPTILEVAANP